MFFPVNKAGDVAPVHKDGEKSHEDAAQHYEKIVVMKYGKPDCESGGTQYGSQGHILSQKIGDGEHGENQKADPPVNHQGDEQAAEDPLAALEAQQRWEIMSQHYADATQNPALQG